MTSVLRIALAYFRMLPLQRWLNSVGCILLALSVFFATTASRGEGVLGSIMLGLFGAMLVAVLPVFAGGAAMRSASSPTMMHLRPHGPLRMVLGATLVITLLALVTLVPVLAGHLNRHLIAPRLWSGEITPLVAFATAWTVLAGTWMLMFALSRSPWTMFFVGLIPLLLIKLGKLLASWMPDPVVALGIAIPAWLAFALWYVRAGSIYRPNMQDPTCSYGMNAPALTAMQDFLDSRGKLTPRERALRFHLLGTASPWTFALGGLWMMLLILLVIVLMPEKERPNVAVTPAAAMAVAMVPALALMCGAFGYSLVRRARQLWLRTGFDRAELFTITERLLLRCMLALLLAAGGSALVVAAIAVPDVAPRLPTYAIAIVVLSVGGSYSGLANTRGADASQVLTAIAIIALGVILTIGALHPDEISTPVRVATWSVLIGMALLLRWQARRRWLALDWRVAKLPQGWRAAQA